MSKFITTVEALLKENADPEIALSQKAYMKHNFEFFGIPAPDRRKLQRDLFNKNVLPPRSELAHIVEELWKKPEREYQYLAQELALKYTCSLEENDIKLFEYMIVNKSWWDSIDYIAPNLVGEYFKVYPNQKDACLRKWLESDNIWLQRTALLFQLKYKEKLDTVALTFVIHSLLGSKEFFINKAIGWILREYSRTDAHWVTEFIQNTKLDKLSQREGLRLIEKMSI